MNDPLCKSLMYKDKVNLDGSFDGNSGFDSNNEKRYSSLFILMKVPIHIDTISMDLSILYFKGPQVKILIYFCP